MTNSECEYTITKNQFSNFCQTNTFTTLTFTDNGNVSSKRRTPKGLKLKRRLAALDLHCFILRINPRTLTEVMLNFLKTAKLTQKWVKSTPSHTINHIFDKKINFHYFIDAVLLQLNAKIRYANHHFCDLVAVVTKVYDKKWGVGKHLVVALEEVRNYVSLLSFATHDWRALKETSKILIIDGQMGSILFYQFVNECAELAMDRKIALNFAFEDTNLRHKYDNLKRGSQESGYLWYESVFAEWNYNEFAKSELLEDKLKKVSVKGAVLSNLQDFFAWLWRFDT